MRAQTHYDIILENKEGQPAPETGTFVRARGPSKAPKEAVVSCVAGQLEGLIDVDGMWASARGLPLARTADVVEMMLTFEISDPVGRGAGVAAERASRCVVRGGPRRSRVT